MQVTGFSHQVFGIRRGVSKHHKLQLGPEVVITLQAVTNYSPQAVSVGFYGAGSKNGTRLHMQHLRGVVVERPPVLQNDTKNIGDNKSQLLRVHSRSG